MEECISLNNSILKGVCLLGIGWLWPSPPRIREKDPKLDYSKIIVNSLLVFDLFDLRFLNWLLLKN